MALKFDKDAVYKKNSGFDFVGEDGIYLVEIIENEIRTEEFEGRYKGSKYHNLKIMFQNGKTKYIKIYYENAEGDIDASGYNFLLSLRNILKEDFEDANKDTSKVLAADSNQIVNSFIKNKRPIYLAFRQSEYKETTYFNLNKFFNPLGDLSDAYKEAEKRKLEVIDLAEETKTEPTQDDDWDDEDDL